MSGSSDIRAGVIRLLGAAPLRKHLAGQVADRLIAQRAVRGCAPDTDAAHLESALALQARQHRESPFTGIARALAAQDQVTIVVPAFNAARYLAETLDSLLAQTHPRLHIVVVDDGSTDGTPEILRRYQRDHGVEVVTLPRNRGIAHAKNEGLKAARGEWLGFLSADDLFYPEAVTTLLEALHTHPEADLAYADFESFGECDYLENPCYVDRLQQVHLDNLLDGRTVGMCVLFRRSLLDGMPSPVDESPELAGVEDAVLWQDLWPRCQFLHVPKVLGRYRRHAGQLTRRIVQSGGYGPLLERSRERLRRKHGRHLRVLFVYPWCSVGGAELVIGRLAVALRRHGVIAEACFLEDLGGRDYLNSLCPTMILDDLRNGRSVVETLAEVINAGGNDVVQYSYVREMAAALELADYPGILVEVDHGWSARCQARRVQPDQLVAVSTAKAHLLEERGMPVAPRVIHNGVDAARLRKTARRVRSVLPPDLRPIVAWVGRMDAVKRPWLFLQMAADLLPRTAEIDFWMVASLSQHSPADQIEAAVALARAHPRFRFFPGVHPGHMPLLYGLIGASRGVVVMTSVDESLPLVPLEAMACGVPVIAARVGGLPEIIDDGVDGFLLDEPFSVAEASHRVETALGDQDAYAAMSRRAQREMAERFSLEAVAGRYRELYRSLRGS